MPPTTRDSLKQLSTLGTVGTPLGGGAALSARDDDSDSIAAPPAPPGVDFPTITPLPFAHGVASGDPLDDRVIIWTRITEATPSAASIPVGWQVATDPAMSNIIRSGTQDTVADRDWTVKVDVTGLSPATTYYYRFSALGSPSITGRTRTAPAAVVSEIRFAVLSCSSYWSSYWSGLGHIADRNDLDLVVHCGDYIYDFVDKDEEVRGRNGIQDTGCPDYRDWLDLTELRRRYALWRSDPNLLRAHQQHPWFIVWDNHDLDPDYGNELQTPKDGEQSTTTLEQTTQVFWEWTPSRPVKADGSGQFILVDDGSYPAPQDSKLVWRHLPFGPMLDVFGVDTQIGMPAHGQELDSSHLASGKSLMGRPQFEWITESMLTSQQKGVLWRFVNNQSWISPCDIPDVVEGIPTRKLGLTRWSDYLEERAAWFRYLRGNNSAQTRVRNNIVVSGDAHGNWGSDLIESHDVFGNYVPCSPIPNQRQGSTADNCPAGWQRDTTGNLGSLNLRADSVGVEFAATSMGRGGIDDNAWDLPQESTRTKQFARAVERVLITVNKNCQFIEWVDHGYGIVHITADHAVFEYWWQDKVTPDSPDVLGQQLITFREDNPLALPSPIYQDQLNSVLHYGMSIAATSGTRVADPAPEGELNPA